MQETQIPSLIWEDPTRLEATAPQLLSLSSGAWELQLLSPLKPGLRHGAQNQHHL